jgi:hypothetical protein
MILGIIRQETITNLMVLAKAKVKGPPQSVVECGMEWFAGIGNKSDGWVSYVVKAIKRRNFSNASSGGDN